jgi:tetratricopeptide (TPR) repeat protein
MSNQDVAFLDPYGETSSLQAARHALALHPAGHPLRSLCLTNLANMLGTRFEQLGDLASLAEAVELHRQALDSRPPGHPDRSMSLNSLGKSLRSQFEQLGDLGLLSEALELFRQALDLRPPGHPERSMSLNNLANGLHSQFEQLGNLDTLADAIELHHQALELRPPGHPDHASSLNNLANSLQTQFEQLGNLDSLDKAVDLYRQALVLHSPGHPYRSISLSSLAIALWTRFRQLGDLDSLAEAVELHREALVLRPPGHPHRSTVLNNLAAALSTQFDELGDIYLLTESVELYRQALALRLPGHPLRPSSMSNLAIVLRTQFEQTGDHHTLNEAAELHREVLSLLPPGHPDLSTFLNNLALTLQTQFQQLGDSDVLAEAIEINRQAVNMCPPGHTNCSRSLSSLAKALRVRFEQLGDLDALAESVELHRQALALRPPGHPGRSEALTNLANALQTRCEQLIDIDSLAEAIEINRQTLHLRPPGHPDRLNSLNNLGNALQTRFLLLDDLESLVEAVELHRQALALSPPGHPVRAVFLHNLANGLRTRCERLGDSDSLTEAIDLYRQTLCLRPQGHPLRARSLNNLAVSLHLGGSGSDLDEEFALYEEGLRLCAAGHPERIRFLFAIGKTMLRIGTHLFNFEGGIHHMMKGLRDRISTAKQSLAFAIDALPMVEAAHKFLIEHPSSCEPARRPQDDLILQVYTQIIRLLPRAASFGLDHAGRLRELSSAETISRDAATRAIAAGRNSDAVEMLEEGRGVFWSQALRLRTTDLDLLPAPDADEVRRLFQLLQVENFSDESTTTAVRERLVEQRRRLSNTAEALIADIRSRPGMSRFLLPPAFSLLVQSLPKKGFVVVLVASNLGHRALVFDCSKAKTHSLELSPPQGGFFSEAVRVTMPRDGDAGVLTAEDTQVSRAFGISKKADRKSIEPLNQTLAQLWTLIAKPVIAALRLKVCSCGLIRGVQTDLNFQKATGSARPRVWWCVTGSLTFLPIHAAGITEGGAAESASNYFVSSYIPTLSALSKSRADWSSISRNMLTGVLAACRDFVDWTPLTSVEQEIEVTYACFRDASAQVVHLSSPNTTVQVLREALEGQSAHILHLACHGLQAASALDSAFLLSDGRLTIQDLMSIRLPNAVLAFLSACQTARGSEHLPDQAVHLAASMLFCGFRSVIGTMW